MEIYSHQQGRPNTEICIDIRKLQIGSVRLSEQNLDLQTIDQTKPFKI